MHGLYETYDKLRNQLGALDITIVMTCVIWNLASVHLETVLVLVEDMCTIYA